MALILESGCRVSEMREGAPIVNGTLSIWNQIVRATGAQAISLRIMEFAPGLSPGIRSNSDEILYVLGWERGHPVRLREHSPRTLAQFFIDGQSHNVAPDTGIYLRSATSGNHVTISGNTVINAIASTIMKKNGIDARAT